MQDESIEPNVNAVVVAGAGWVDSTLLALLIGIVALDPSRSKEVDWQPYFTTRLVDDFATHLRVFRKAQDRLPDKEDKQSKRRRSRARHKPPSAT